MTTETTQGTTTLAKKEKSPIATFAEYIEGKKAEIAKVLPRHMSADRIAKGAVTAAMRTPGLLSCDVKSVYLAIHQCAQLGLEPGSPLGHAYLIPYGKDCQLVLGYRGLIDLARRSGQIVSLEAHVVHEADKFTLRYGLDARLDHEPCISGDPGQPLFAYALARLVGGGVQYEVMSAHEINKIRDRDPRRAAAVGRGQTPWATDWSEMARKTVVRRLFKYLPVSVEIAEALAGEDAAEPIDVTPAGPQPQGSRVRRATATVEDPEEPTADAETGEVPGADPFDGLGSEAREIAEAIMAAKTAPEKKALVAKAQAALVDGKISGDERKALLALAGM